jgi:predicted transcriptional regulator
MKKSALAKTVSDPLTAPAKPIPDYSRLSYSEIALAVKLREDGLTQDQIAQRLGCSQPTICQLLKEFSDTRPLAKLKANNLALKLLQRVEQQANVEESLEVLDRTGVIEKRQVDTGRGGNVNIVIGMPGAAAGPDPLSPVVTRELPLKSTG